MPWASQAAWHLESAQLIKFDICAASGRALDRLRKAAAAVITSLRVEELAPIFLPACITTYPSARPLPPLATPQNRANDSSDRCPQLPTLAPRHTFLELWVEATATFNLPNEGKGFLAF